MAAFNVNMGNNMVMQSAARVHNKNRKTFEDNEQACGCLWKTKTSNRKLQKERIKQFSIWFEEVDNARQKEFVHRRFDRQYKRDQKRKRVRCFRRFFIPTAILWLVGFCITLASTVQSLGEGTIFWTERETFVIVGPVTLGCGLLLLMVTEGLISSYQMKMKELESTEVQIDVDGCQEHVKNSSLNPGQQTLKSVSDKLPRLQQRTESKQLYSDTESLIPQNPSVNQKTLPLKQKSEQIIDSSKLDLQKYKLQHTELNSENTGPVENTRESKNRPTVKITKREEEDELLLGATAIDFEADMSKDFISHEYEKMLTSPRVPPK